MRIDPFSRDSRRPTGLGLLLLILCLLTGAGTALAQPGYSYGPGSGEYYQGAPSQPYGGGYGYRGQPGVAEQGTAAAALKAGMEHLLGFLRQSPPPNQAQIAAYLEAEVAPSFDFAYMARAAAGPVYRNLDNARRARLQQKLKVMFLGTLAARLSEFDQQQVQYLPPRRGSGDQATLTVLIQNQGGYPARLDFRMRRGNDGWRVVDVAANNSSALAFYRNYFSKAMSGRPGGPYGGGYR